MLLGGRGLLIGTHCSPLYLGLIHQSRFFDLRYSYNECLSLSKNYCSIKLLKDLSSLSLGSFKINAQSCYAGHLGSRFCSPHKLLQALIFGTVDHLHIPS